MNSKERIEWLQAVRACLPDVDIRAMSAACAALEGAASGRWEVSVSGRGLHSVGLRFFGEGAYAPWLAAAAKTFGLGAWRAARAPRPDFPWLNAAWDLKTGVWTFLRFYGGIGGRPANGQALAWDFTAGVKTPARRLLNCVVFKPGIFKEPDLDRVFEDFSLLCPPASLSVEEPGWSLRLTRPLRWPLFARCDVAAAFTPHSSQLALFLLDRRVTELSFDGEALWAHCSG